ncbi:MAG: sortase [Chloroflexi bacterium]|nr:sortase [Chloroflexota bacterium]
MSAVRRILGAVLTVGGLLILLSTGALYGYGLFEQYQYERSLSAAGLSEEAPAAAAAEPTPAEAALAPEIATPTGTEQPSVQQASGTAENTTQATGHPQGGAPTVGAAPRGRPRLDPQPPAPSLPDSFDADLSALPTVAVVALEWDYPSVPHSPTATATPVPQPTATLTPQPTATPTPRPVTPPRRIVSPRIGLNAPVVEAPIQSGEWKVPKFVAGHLEGTAYPGQGSNVALSGHVQSIAGGNVFASLDKLKPGDEVRIETAVGWFTYVVSKMRIVANDDISVVMPTRREQLTLITCTGAWNPVTRDYTQRIVVTADLSSAPGAGNAGSRDRPSAPAR